MVLLSRHLIFTTVFSLNPDLNKGKSSGSVDCPIIIVHMQYSCWTHNIQLKQILNKL